MQEGGIPQVLPKGPLSPEQVKAQRITDFKGWVEHLSDSGPKFWDKQAQDFRAGNQMVELSDIGMGNPGDRKMVTDDDAVALLRTKDWGTYLAIQRHDADLRMRLGRTIDSNRKLVTNNAELGSPVSEEQILKAQLGGLMNYMDWLLAKHECLDRLEAKLKEAGK